MKKHLKPLKLVKCKRVTFNRDWRHADAKRLHSADLTFTPQEWELIEEQWEQFLQPDTKIEDVEYVYVEDKKKTETAEPSVKSE